VTWGREQGWGTGRSRLKAKGHDKNTKKANLSLFIIDKTFCVTGIVLSMLRTSTW
jgi:hypothetical protein